MATFLILGSASSIGNTMEKIEDIASNKCLDYINEALLEVQDKLFTDSELTCITNWLMAECKGYDVTEEDYESCLK